MLSGKTKFIGLIGDPVSHSFSPTLHNGALLDLGLNWVYLPFQVTPPQLVEAVQGLWALGCQGFNVTIPHKQTIMPLLSGMTTEAKAIGAVNTVCRTDQGWFGHNTDLTGFVAPLRSQSWQGKQSLILGNGGAARAVIMGCIQLGFTTIYVLGRNSEKLAQLQQDFPQIQPLLQLETALLATVDLIINTTPLGMTGYSHTSPLTPAQLAHLQPETLIYDLVYNPTQTLLLHQANNLNLKTLGGLTMLVEQGVEALALWTGETVSTPELYAQLLPLIKTGSPL